MSSNINLHIHTTYSDGGNTPAEVVAMLKDTGVTTFSITDHDTVEGNVEAAALAEEHGLTHINGIELSCCFADGEIGLDESWVIHILGYGFDLELMRDKLAELGNKKHTQLRELFNLLVADGYNIDIDKITQDGKIAERTHIAKELIRQGYAVDGNEAFAKILNTNRYRPFAKYKPTIKEGIKINHDCGGLAVWAHPFGVTRGGKKELTQEQALELSKKMRVYGLNGMEVYYQQYTLEQIDWLNNEAESWGRCNRLYKTVGTDYHNAAVDLTKYPEYAEAKKRERLAFDVVEPDAGADTTIRRILNPKSDKEVYPHKNIVNYERYRFKCEKCGWSGLGSEIVISPNTINNYVARCSNCPECGDFFELIHYPCRLDMQLYGSVEEQQAVIDWTIAGG